MFTQDYFIISFLIAVLSFVYTNILTEPEEILASWKKWLYRLNSEERLNSGQGFHPLYKVLVHCEKCFSGQAAVWVYLVLSFRTYSESILIPKAIFILILKHILFITLTIFITAIIKKVYDKL